MDPTTWPDHGSIDGLGAERAGQVSDEPQAPDAVWAQRIHRARWPATVILSGSCTAAGLGDWLGAGPGQLRSPAAVLLLAALLGTLVAVERTAWWSAIPIGLGLTGIGVAAVDDPPTEAATAWWPSFVAAVLGSYLLIRFGARRRVLAAALAVLVVAKLVMLTALVAAADGPIDLITVLDLILQFAQNLAIVLVVAIASRLIPALAKVADAAELPVHQRRLLASVMLRQRRQQDAARRCLHDEVLPALRLVASGEPNHLMCRQAAVRAIDHLTPRTAGESTAFVDVVPLLLMAVDRAGVQVWWHGVDRLLAPRAVADAMAGSLAELLRNVRQHAGVGTASVTVGPIRWSPGSVRVVVNDGGRGFDTRRSRPGRLGLAESVTARLHEVDGRCSVRSRPGRGSSVQLAWRLPPTRRSGGILDIVPPSASRPVLLVASIVPALNILAYLFMWRELRTPWLALTAAVALFLGTVAVARVAAARRFNAIGSAAAIALAVGTVLLVAVGVGAGGTDPAALAIAGPAAAPVAIVCAVRPHREGLLGTAALTIVVVWVSFGWLDLVGRSGWLTVATAPAFGAVIGWAVGAMFDLMRGELGLAKAANLQARDNACGVGDIAMAARELVDRTNPAIVPLLQVVAMGQNCQGYQASAAHAELGLRDALQLGAAPRTLAAAGRLRAARWNCTLLLPNDPPQELDAAAADLLLQALPEADDAARSTGTAGAPGSIVLSVLRRPGGWVVSRIVRARNGSADQLRCFIPVPAIGSAIPSSGPESAARAVDHAMIAGWQ